MKFLANCLAAMFYEVLCRLIGVYNEQKKSIWRTASFQRGMNELHATNTVMAVFYFDSMVFIKAVCWLFGLPFDFYKSLLVGGVISFLLAILLLHRNSYFEEVFLPAEKALSASTRIYHYLISTIVFILIPAVLLGFLLID